MQRCDPTTRSRTSLFLSYRDSRSTPTPSTPFTRYARDDDDDDDWRDLDEEQGLIRPAPGPGPRRPPTTTLPPPWVDLADQVDAVVKGVVPKIALLDKLHAKHLLPGFKDRTAEEREIDSLATAITADFRVCQSHIRRIAEQSHALLATRPRDAADAERKRIDLLLAANVQTALATKVQELSTTFRKKQAGYLRQLKGHESKAAELQHRATYDPLVALAEDEQASRSALSAATPSLAQQQFFSPSASTSTAATAMAVDQRTSEIASIAHSIADLADMFKDLSSLVIDQGTLLDRVDYNVDLLRDEVRGAAQELAAATRHQRRSGKCQLILLLVLAVLAALVVLTLRPPRSPWPARAGAPTAAEGEGERQREREARGMTMASTAEIAQKLTDDSSLGGGARTRPRPRHAADEPDASAPRHGGRGEAQAVTRRAAAGTGTAQARARARLRRRRNAAAGRSGPGAALGAGGRGPAPFGQGAATGD
ncbi:hypothetical protein JCM3770_003520 [Rhodotorula araucariae]